MSAGVAFSKSEKQHSYTPYQFPLLLSMLSRSRPLRQMKKELGLKIGRQMHSSSKEVISKDMPFLKIIAGEGENAALIAAQFDMNEDELAFLLDTKPDTKKVQNTLSKAAELRSKNIAAKTFHRPFHMHETAAQDYDAEKIPETAPVEEDASLKQTKLF
jgi:hypothetical protein